MADERFDTSDRHPAIGHPDRPRVTFALFAYNQEPFIRAAVEAVLSQDYEPLEIILSDDCSTDRTFAIMQQVCAARDGERQVTLRQTPENCGLARHIDQVMACAGGDLVVIGAGDDISLPTRVSTLVREWLAAGRPAALSSQARIISDSGEIISERFTWHDGMYPEPGETRHSSIQKLLEQQGRTMLGSAQAWSRRIFDVFGPLQPSVIHEDNAVSLRAWLLDRIIFLDAPLVLYRTHATNLYHRTIGVALRSSADFVDHETRAIALKKNAVATLHQHVTDLETALRAGLISSDEHAYFESLLIPILQRLSAEAGWWQAGILAKTKLLLEWASKGDYGSMRHYAPRAVSLPTFGFLRSLLAATSRQRRKLFGARN